MTVVVVSAGLSQPSTSRLLADQLGAAVARALRSPDGPVDRFEGVHVQTVDLRPLAHELVNNLLTGFPSGALADALDAVRAADALVVVTPVFNASYSGLFKMFVDVLDEGALEGTPVLLAATGGTGRHSLALDFAMRPLFAHLRAAVVPTAVFAASEDFAGDGSAAALSARVERAARELADAVHGRARSTPTDPFAHPTPFARLLTGS